MATWYGWPVVTMPSDPPAPASFEFAPVAVIGEHTNPFSGQQQTQDWGGRWSEASVSFAQIPKAKTQPWKSFIKSLDGQKSVFTFGSAFCAAYPDEFTIDGSNPRHWRLKSNRPQWTVSAGGFMSLTFEIVEAKP